MKKIGPGASKILLFRSATVRQLLVEDLRGSNFFNFMQFLGNFGKSVCSRPPPLPPVELVAPPRENPESATG